MSIARHPNIPNIGNFKAVTADCNAEIFQKTGRCVSSSVVNLKSQERPVMGLPDSGTLRDINNQVTNLTSTPFKIDDKIVLIGGGILLLLFVL